MIREAITAAGLLAFFAAAPVLAYVAMLLIHSH